MRSSCFRSESQIQNHLGESAARGLRTFLPLVLSFFFRATGGARVSPEKAQGRKKKVWHFSTAEKALSKVIMNCLV